MYQDRRGSADSKGIVNISGPMVSVPAVYLCYGGMEAPGEAARERTDVPCVSETLWTLKLGFLCNYHVSR